MTKTAKELAIHDKDTGSSEVQVAQLTEKIENLSKHIKQFKKDKHSSVGLLRAVNRRKKLLIADMDSTILRSETLDDLAILIGKIEQIKKITKDAMDGKINFISSLEERVKVVKEHLDFSIRWKGERVGIVEMRRHYANYFKGIPNFKPIRTQLVTLESTQEIYSVLNNIVNQFELEPV